MSLISIDIGQPLCEVEVPENASAAAVAVLRDGLPVQFFVRAAEPGAIITVAQLHQWMLHEGPVSPARPLPASSGNTPPLSITVALCTKDRPEWAARCLDSILSVCRDAPEVEILVVDNAPSNDLTRDASAARERVRYIREAVPGLNFARNRALREARGEILAFIDDDAVMGPSWLLGVRTAWLENPDAGCCCGPVLPYEMETPAQFQFEWRGGFGRNWQPLRKVHQGPDAPLHPVNVFGAGCNMIFRRESLLALGGFDVALDTGAPLPGGGDLDMLYRVQQAGYPVINEPLCVVFHQHRRTHAELRWQMWTWGLTVAAYHSKIYSQNPKARLMLLRYIRHRLYRQLVTLLVRLFRLSWKEYPPDLIFAELLGGLVGFTGTYRRSVARTTRLQEIFSAR